MESKTARGSRVFKGEGVSLLPLKFVVLFLIWGISCAPPPASRVKVAEEGAPIDTIGITKMPAKEITKAPAKEITETPAKVETVYVTTVETVVETVEVVKEIPVEKMVSPGRRLPFAPDEVGEFKVQIGAFGNEENANSLHNALKDKYGELIYIENIPPYWKVRIGNYSTWSKAILIRDELRAKGFGDAWIVRAYQ